jgi:hypothetical protein
VTSGELVPTNSRAVTGEVELTSEGDLILRLRGSQGRHVLADNPRPTFHLWVPNWSSTSCDLGVFVYQSAEQVATSEAKLGWRRVRW